MAARQPDQEANQWPGAPPAAERKAAEVEDDFTREGTEATPERTSAARVDDSPTADSAPDTAAAETAGRETSVPHTPIPAAPDAETVGAEPAGAEPAVPGMPAPEPVDGPATLLEPDHTEEFRRRWDAIKASFVDDPREAVRRAEQLAEEVVAEVARTVDARRRDLIERREGIGDQDDKSRTERLRVVLHGYRSVLEPVLRR